MEDIQHCLFTCPRAMDILSELGLNDVISQAVCEDHSGSVTLETLSKLRGVVAKLPKA